MAWLRLKLYPGRVLIIHNRVGKVSDLPRKLVIVSEALSKSLNHQFIRLVVYRHLKRFWHWMALIREVIL